MKYFFYIVRCSDNSLYSGITTDLKRRINEHNSDGKKRAKYLRAKKPVTLVYSEKFKDRNTALVREAEVKKLSKSKKESLIIKMKHGENPIKSFEFNGVSKPVSFVSKMDVIDGVVCDVYSFVDDNRMDLGIVTIQPGKKTPLQKVLLGDKTIEGFLAGKGKLTITKLNGKIVTHFFDNETKDAKSIPVAVGEIMQWEADEDSELIFSEVCYPPYEDGRFENLMIDREGYCNIIRHNI